MSEPNAAPATVEAQLLREMIAEFRELRREVIRMRSEFASVVAAQQQLGIAIGIPIVLNAPRPTPPPAMVDARW